MCAESAVKPHAGEDVSFSCMLQPTLTDYVIIHYSLVYSALQQFDCDNVT